MSAPFPCDIFAATDGTCIWGCRTAAECCDQVATPELAPGAPFLCARCAVAAFVAAHGERPRRLEPERPRRPADRSSHCDECDCPTSGWRVVPRPDGDG